MNDKTIRCRDCGQDFVFTVGEQQFFAQKGFNDRVICKQCSDAKKAKGNVQPRGNSVSPQNQHPSSQSVSSTEYKFLNPYNFVRFLDDEKDFNPQTAETALLGRCQPPPHDRYVGLSGVIHCLATVETPLFIPDAHGIEVEVVNAKDKKEHRSYRFFEVEGRKVIPGSSLRGMLRSVFEAATNSCMGVFDENAHYSFRYESEEARRLIPSRIENGKVKLLTGTVELPTKKNMFPDSIYGAWVPSYKGMDVNLRTDAETRSILENKDKRTAYWAEMSRETHPKPYFQYWKVRRLYWEKPQKVQESPNLIVRQGYLFITNQNADNKHDERFFFCNEKFRMEFELSPGIREEWRNLIENYKNEHEADIEGILRKGDNPFLSRIDDEGKRKPAYSSFLQASNQAAELSEGDLCYADVDYDEKTTKYTLVRLLPVSIPRAMQPNTVGELLPEAQKHCSNPDNLCPACRVFGWLKGCNAYRGRVRVSQGNVTVEKKSANSLILAVLGTPKPTTGRFYLQKRTVNSPVSKLLDGIAVKNIHCRYDAEQNELRGRKFYRHHGNASLPEAERAGKSKDQFNRTLRNMLGTGSVFEFEVTFENLEPVELGALLWAIEIEKGFHRLGYAKPLGLGSISIDIQGISCLNEKSRYSTFDNIIETASTETALPAEWVKKFMDAMTQKHSVPFSALPNIADICALTRPPQWQDTPVHYPRTAKTPDEKGKNYEWFMGNKRVSGQGSGPHRALGLPGDESEKLPLIDKYGTVKKC